MGMTEMRITKANIGDMALYCGDFFLIKNVVEYGNGMPTDVQLSMRGGARLEWVSADEVREIERRPRP